MLLHLRGHNRRFAWGAEKCYNEFRETETDSALAFIVHIQVNQDTDWENNESDYH